ncbi:hypothetical protein [Yoonia sp. BS5-3]|uniref:DUF3311 domain-containing protein n=1 Tax=Yoonia phaeophyticola TaxID=3137369 RepID=A0ABZ2V1L2_9RHOB
MSSPKNASVFLERASYKQRRLTDAARLLPILGMLLWAIPLLWGADEPVQTSNAPALLYVFGVWMALIAVSALIARWLEPGEEPFEAEGKE